MLRNLVVNALVTVNVWAFQSGLLFLSRFYCKCTRFCVKVLFKGKCMEFFVCLSPYLLYLVVASNAHCKCMGISGFLFFSRHCDCTRFCVDVPFFTVNV